jgi:hypothetical protein
LSRVTPAKRIADPDPKSGVALAINWHDLQTSHHETK